MYVLNCSINCTDYGMLVGHTSEKMVFSHDCSTNTNIYLTEIEIREAADVNFSFIDIGFELRLLFNGPVSAGTFFMASGDQTNVERTDELELAITCRFSQAELFCFVKQFYIV